MRIRGVTNVEKLIQSMVDSGVFESSSSSLAANHLTEMDHRNSEQLIREK